MALESSTMEVLRRLLQDELLKHEYPGTPLNTVAGQEMAIRNLRSAWCRRPISLTTGEIVEIADIKRGGGSDENFVELLVSMVEGRSLTVTATFVDDVTVVDHAD